MTNCKIALLVPCYNGANYINKFIIELSALNNQFDEIIFYNDGSTDNTLEMLKKSGYRYVHSAINNGPGFARNKLAEVTTCSYIHFHDVDDTFNPAFISLTQDILFNHRPDVLFGNAEWVDAKTGSLQIKWTYNYQQMKDNALLYFLNHPLGIINTIYKRNAFLSINGFDETIHCWEDADLHIRLAANNKTFEYIDVTLAYSIRHGNGISKNQKWCWECRLSFLLSYLDNLPCYYKNDILNEIAKCAQAFYNFGIYSKLTECYVLCKRYDMHLPISKSRIISILKWLKIPTRHIYYFQSIVRKLS